MVKNSLKKLFIDTIFPILSAVVLVGGLAYAWTEPTSAPPGGNVAAPLNVGNLGQAKAGGLMLNTGGAATGLIVDKGNVGIGTQTPNSSKGANGYLDAADVYLRGAGKWASDGIESYALLRDQKSDGANSGQFVAGDWRTRDLNTEAYDSNNIVSLASNQFTLQSGTYRIYAMTPAYNVGTHKARLQNISDGVTVLWGTNAYLSTGSPGMFWSVIVGEFTISSAKTFQLQDRCSNTGNEISLGVQDNIPETSEIYSVVEIWKTH